VAKREVEIVVEDPGAPADDSPALSSTRTVDIGVSLLLLALAALLAFDNWRTCLYGLVKEFIARRQASDTFVTLDQFRRVVQVFIPTLLFCVLMQWLGLYVASFLLVAGFMKVIGRIAAWKAVLTALVFSVAMYVTFDIAFDVIMPKGPLEALFGH
jgi:uncharacterized membrane protein